MNELKTFILHHLLPAVITYRANKLPFFKKILSEQFCLIFGEEEYYSDNSLKGLYCDRANFGIIIVWLFYNCTGHLVSISHYGQIRLNHFKTLVSRPSSAQ